MKRPRAKRLAGDRRSAAAIEFALLGSVFLLIFIGFIELGFAVWTIGALQSAAALTARCVAIGSPQCSNPQQFAVSMAGSWTFAAVISASDVTVASSSTCNGVAGTYQSVTIACPICSSGWLIAPFMSLPTTISECYPINTNPLS